MATYRVHHSANRVSVWVTGGSNYFIRARWATEISLLNVPPGGALTPVNYFESLPVYAPAPTNTSPAVLHLDTIWWGAIRDTARNLYVVIEWLQNTPNAKWRSFEFHTFIINHNPVANAGPDQRIELDPAGTVPYDVLLDASASDDPDLHELVNPDPGPLSFDWWPIETPLSISPGGLAWAAAHGMPKTSRPVFLTAGSVIPPSDRGAYTFRLWVKDTEVADIGAYSGQNGLTSAETRVLVGVSSPQLKIESPSTANPHISNMQDGVGIYVYYSIGDTVANAPEYAGAWVVKCTINLAQSSPVYAAGPPVGTTVYEATKVSFQRVNYFTWDGRISDGPLSGLAVAGAFNVRLELLDRNWQPTGIAGSTDTANRSIVIDVDRWNLPIRGTFATAALSGAFMESGHAGDLGTRLHTGIDIVDVNGGRPDLIAARSGFYASAGDVIMLTHTMPDQTRYRHGDMFEPHAVGDLVLQGERLARMSDIGVPGSVHLHFEHHTFAPASIRNPLGILGLVDGIAPAIEAVVIRRASVAGQPADLTLPSSGIDGFADLIIQCRDRAHPGRNTPLNNGPYRVMVEEANGVGVWPQIRFDSMTAADHLRKFFALQGQFGNPVTPANHYLLYLRWDTGPYGRTVSPLRLRIIVADFAGGQREHILALGPTAVIAAAPPDPAMSASAPHDVHLTMSITNAATGIGGLASENCHIELIGAPLGWTVTPTRSGAIANGLTSPVPLIIHLNGNVPVGLHAMSIGIYSNVILNVGMRVPLSIRITP